MNHALAISAITLLSFNALATRTFANEVPRSLASSSPVPQQSNALQPIRQGRFRYIVSEQSFKKLSGSAGVTSQKYAEVCKGEVEIPVYGNLVQKSGVSYQPKQITCEAQTGRGPMELDLYVTSMLRTEFSVFDKSSMPAKSLDVGFSLFDNPVTGKVSFVNEYYHTHTADLAEETMNLRAQITPIHTAVEGGEQQDQFYIRLELIDDQQ